MKSLICYLALFMPLFAYSQKTDTLIRKLDSLDKKADTVSQKNIINEGAYNEVTKITAKNYVVLLGSDFKQQLLSPFTLGKKSWLKVAKFGAIAGGLLFADEPVQQEVVTWRLHSNLIKNLSSYLSNSGGIYEGGVLVALSAYGFASKNEKIKTTSLLATQAYITGEVFNQVIKNLTSRQRPSAYNQDRVESEPKFGGPFASSGRDADGKKLNASFPSGHATLAFAAATVYAMEYRNSPIVPIFAYTGATLISLSRITENAHWITDVFVGATLGYLTGRQVVNNYHRYAKIQNTKSGVGKFSLNIQHTRFGMLPGVVFRTGK